MKKIMIALVMIIILTADAFAGDEKVKPEVLKAFKNQFTSAQNVTWEVGNNYYKACFNCNGTWMFVCYNTEAKFLYTVRHFASTELPYYLQKSLKKTYGAYWITDLFEMSNGQKTSYYISLKDADNTVILESNNRSHWKYIDNKQN